MQQGYIPPKQQKQDDRKRRTQKNMQNGEKANNSIDKENVKYGSSRLLRTCLAVVAVVAVIIGVSQITGNLRKQQENTADHPDSVQSRVPMVISNTPVVTSNITSAPTETWTVTPVATPTATRKPYITLSRGAIGSDVRTMQSRLLQLGYLNDIVDGDYGSKTEKAVELFQRQHVMDVTGIADDGTLLLLYSNEAEEYQPPRYAAGMYKGGYDIPVGEYIVLANSEYSAYFCLSSDSNADHVIVNDIFDYNSIVTVQHGEYLEISHAYMMLLSDYIANNTIPKNISGVMYKVGTNLKSGEYKLITTADRSGYYCIYDSSRQDVIVSNDIFENRTYVTVKNGQYLALSNCAIAD